jgi:hypothetical protein
VDICIEAAGNEFNPEVQKQLLRAASFGKCFLESYNTEHFVNMCRVLRVLNAVRHHDIGIWLTYEQ